mmetsp:Transcript_13845/g.40543  ORF Transcript_13845/g.40543 Transcript_13845/m.40543 type:complete len:218 (-) Transcript_13845:1107-1760(-)
MEGAFDDLAEVVYAVPELPLCGRDVESGVELAAGGLWWLRGHLHVFKRLVHIAEDLLEHGEVDIDGGHFSPSPGQRVWVRVCGKDLALEGADGVHFKEEPLVKASREYVNVEHLEVGAEQGLVVPRVWPNEHEPFVSEDEHVVFGDVVGRLGVADDLPQLILVLTLVHVLLRQEVRYDLIRHNELHLAPVLLVVPKNEPLQVELALGHNRIHHDGGV